MTIPENSDPIYFVVSKIREPLKTQLRENRTLPPSEKIMAEIYHQKTGIATGEISWILQTFLQMKESGLNVVLTENPVEGSICVAHFDYLRDQILSPNLFIVGIRSDRSPLYVREIEVVQSPAHLGYADQFFMPHWPQFGLIKRDIGRKNLIKSIRFFGRSINLDRDFTDPSFLGALKAMDIELNICFDPKTWNDYSQTDIVLAVRNNLHPWRLKSKPATKLFNSWLAGCIPLLGNEPAFRAIGRSGIDYFEVNTPDEVLNILKELKSNPTLAEQVRQNGLRRGTEFEVEIIRQQWVNFLTGPVANAFEKWKKERDKNPTLGLMKRYQQSTNQWLAHKAFWSYIHAVDILKGRTTQERKIKFLSKSD